MPFNRPILSTLIERARDDFDARLPGADSRLRRSVLDVLARVHAAATNGLYGFLNWISLQVFPDTAETEQLARWAAIWGVSRKASVPAAGGVDVTGANGSAIPAGTTLVRSDSVEYLTTADAVIAGGVATLQVEAIDAGVGGNAAAAQRLVFSSPVAGVNANATIAAGGLTGGADEEADESLRARLLDRIRRPPHGGNADDYRRWTLEVPEVTRAWVYPLQLGPGTVTVVFVMDGREDMIPTVDDVADVQAYIDVLRPVTADVTVIAPAPVALDFTISAAPPTAEVQAAVVAELEDLLFREAEPGGTILISHIDEAVSLAAGELDHDVTTPAGNVTAAVGSIFVMGAVTWVA
jgi:uncharacterized phage protein gp47/JayE